MTRDLDRASIDSARCRAYHRDFWPGIVGYCVVLWALVLWGGMSGPNRSRYALALLPILPLLLVVRAVVRHLHRMDEYQRLLLLEGWGIGFAVAMLASITLGLLGSVGLPMRGAGWVIYAAGMLGWLVSAMLGRKR